MTEMRITTFMKDPNAGIPPSTAAITNGDALASPEPRRRISLDLTRRPTNRRPIM